MSHDCDCDQCMETDSRWAPYRKQQRALKEDCPRGVHEPEMYRCTLGVPDSAEYWCANCKVRVTKDGKVLSPFGRNSAATELKASDLTLLAPAMRCAVHPKYQGKRRPRASCETCHYIWEKNQK